jgi:imidazolonepropionase-like amidohydrolase
MQRSRQVSRRSTAALALLVWTGVAVSAAAETVAITGGKVFPVSGPPIERATVLITDGTITAVGQNLDVPPGAAVLDAAGMWVTPGLINSATSLGIVEIGAVRQTDDTRARGEKGIAAAFRVWEGLNPSSVLWAPARSEGVTSVAVLPSGGLVSGQGAFVDTLETQVSAMVRRAPVAMVADIAWTSSTESTARGETLMRLRELLEDTRAHVARKTAFEAGNTRAFTVGRVHLEAMAPVLAGKIPLLVEADRVSDVEAAVALASEYKLRIIVLSGAEAWRVAPRLASANVPVVTTALENIPSSFATLASRRENAAILREAGVKVAIMAGRSEAFNVRNIRQHAGNAVAYGLSWDEALRAVTLTPAEIFGVDAHVGSIQPGRDANIVVWDGDPFEFSTRAVRVFIRGRETPSHSRQDDLTDRYKPR